MSFLSKVSLKKNFFEVTMKMSIARLVLQGRLTYPDACVAIKGYVRCVNPAKDRNLERLRRGSFFFF